MLETLREKFITKSKFLLARETDRQRIDINGVRDMINVYIADLQEALKKTGHEHQAEYNLSHKGTQPSLKIHLVNKGENKALRIEKETNEIYERINMTNRSSVPLISYRRVIKSKWNAIRSFNSPLALIRAGALISESKDLASQLK